MFFKPRLLTNQVILTLFLGMVLIVLPFFLQASHAAEEGATPTVKCDTVSPAEETPAPSAPDTDGDSGSVANDGDVEIAQGLLHVKYLNDSAA